MAKPAAQRDKEYRQRITIRAVNLERAVEGAIQAMPEVNKEIIRFFRAMACNPKVPYRERLKAIDALRDIFLAKDSGYVDWQEWQARVAARAQEMLAAKEVSDRLALPEPGRESGPGEEQEELSKQKASQDNKGQETSKEPLTH